MKTFPEIFSQYFGAPCILTAHARERLVQRFLKADMENLRFLISGGLNKFPVDQWEAEKKVVFRDQNRNIALVCAFDPQNKAVVLVTLMRIVQTGKPQPIHEKTHVLVDVSISQEKTKEEVRKIKANFLLPKRQQVRMPGFP